MHRKLMAVALLAVASGPAGAQDASPDLTCGAFLALDEDGQMAAMLELRAAHSGETIGEPEEAEAATVVTGATEAGAIGGADGGPSELPHVEHTPEATQRLSGMRTSCEGVPDTPAVDAMVAAHADYEPVFENAAPPD